jgi:predicted ATPase/DNA-binding CsgD family transcriptional regulator
VTSPNRDSNLPVPATPLLGRERELAQARATLLRNDVRLVTLTGPGGTGKTRLALQVAAEVVDQFADGVVFVDLAPLVDPARLSSTIAPLLGVSDSGDDLLEDLKRAVHDRALLLLLDNFEQILPAAPIVADLLAACPGVKILVTSRAALQLRGEHELEVPPLGVPDLDHLPPPEALQQHGAIALFVERAQAVRADFELTAQNARAVATVCARLDGLPLALELAAARTRVLDPSVLAERLDRRLPLLTGGPRDAPARQRTLRDTIAWSYGLLDEPEQRAFRVLSVFVGGFTLDAAERVASSEGRGTSEIDADSPLGPHPSSLDLVEQLVARSLVRRLGEIGGEPRFGMLETIREFGLEMLEANGESARIRDAHLACCIDLADHAIRQAAGPNESGWLDRIEAEHDNMRAALQWSVRSASAAPLGLRLATTLGGNFWPTRGYHREGRAWLEQLLPHAARGSRERGKMLQMAGYLALRQNDYPAASAAYEEALEIWRALHDRRQIAATLRHYGVVPHHLGDFATARQMLEESLRLSQAVDDRYGTRLSMRNLADLYGDSGDLAAAVSSYEQTLSSARAENDHHETACALRGLGHLALAQGQYGRAEQYLRESLTLLKPLRDRRCTPLSLEGLACITVGPGWADRSARLLGAAQAMQAQTGAPSPPSTRADYVRTVADARQALGQERFEAAWAAGAAMGLDAAVDLALGERRSDGQATGVPLAIGTPADAPRSVVPLTPREQEVVTLIAQGFSNRQISERLTLSVRTVERHIENVYNRLGISGRAGRAIVTAYALRHGLIAPA